MMQLDFVGPFKSSMHKFVLTGNDLLSWQLIIAPLTIASADTADEINSKIFSAQHFYPK